VVVTRIGILKILAAVGSATVMAGATANHVHQRERMKAEENGVLLSLALNVVWIATALNPSTHPNIQGTSVNRAEEDRPTSGQRGHS
jgi:hypothetical protein